MRVQCNIPELDDNWIEVDERWTRAEMVALYEATIKEVFDTWILKKVSACNIVVGEDIVTDPALLTFDSIDDVDVRVYGFLAGALYEAVGNLFLASKTSARALSPTSDTA